MTDLGYKETGIRFDPRDPKTALLNLQKVLEGSLRRIITAVNSRQTTDEELNIKVYNQNDEPTLSADENAAFWIDADGGPAYYLVFRVSSGTQVKVALT